MYFFHERINVIWGPDTFFSTETVFRHSTTKLLSKLSKNSRKNEYLFLVLPLPPFSMLSVHFYAWSKGTSIFFNIENGGRGGTALEDSFRLLEMNTYIMQKWAKILVMSKFWQLIMSQSVWKSQITIFQKFIVNSM